MLSGLGGHLAQRVHQHLDLVQVVVVGLAEGFNGIADIFLRVLLLLRQFLVELPARADLFLRVVLRLRLHVAVEIFVFPQIELLQSLGLGQGLPGLLPQAFHFCLGKLLLQLGNPGPGFFQVLFHAFLFFAELVHAFFQMLHPHLKFPLFAVKHAVPPC